MPGAQLKADLLIDPHGLESKTLVKSDAGIIWQGNARVGIVEAQQSSAFEQRQIKRSTDSLSMIFRIDIHGDIDRPSIGRAFSMLARVRISKNPSLAFIDQPGRRRRQSLAELRCARNGCFKRDRGVAYVRSVDRQEP